MPRSNFFFIARYVDDVVAASKCLCTRCLQNLVGRIHGQSMHFGDSGTTSNISYDDHDYTTAKFLDMYFALAWTPLVRVFPAVHNELWMWGHGERQRHRHRLYDSTFNSADFQLCVQKLRGRRLRWIDTCLENHCLNYVVALDIFEMLVDGYPWKFLYQMWHAIPASRDRDIALNILRALRPEFQEKHTASLMDLWPDSPHKSIVTCVQGLSLDTLNCATSFVNLALGGRPGLLRNELWPTESPFAMAYGNWGKGRGGKARGKGPNYAYGNQNWNNAPYGSSSAFGEVDQLNNILGRIQGLGQIAQLGLQLAGQQQQQTGSSTPGQAAPTAQPGSQQANSGLGGLQRLITGSATPTTQSAQHVHTLASSLTQGGQPGGQPAAGAVIASATQPPPPGIVNDPDFVRLQAEVRQLRGTSDETVTRLTAVERVQQQQGQTLSKIDNTLAAVATRLGVAEAPTRGTARPKRAAAASGEADDMHSCASDTAVAIAGITPAANVKLSQLKVTKEKHENFISALEISDSAFEALICCPEWDDEPQLEMPGDEWWEFVQDALPSLGAWRQRVLSAVPRHQKAQKARTKATFVQALLDESLDSNLNAIM